MAGTVSISNSLAGFAVIGWVLRESERVGLRPRRADATLCGRDREAIRANKSSISLLIRASNRGEKRLTSVTRLKRKLTL